MFHPSQLLQTSSSVFWIDQGKLFISLTMSELIDALKRRGQTQYCVEAFSQLKHA